MPATIVGTVSRVMGSTIVDSQQTAQGNAAAYIARSVEGKTIGFGRSASEAQAILNRTNGTLLRWTRSDLRGGIEFYTGSYG